MAEEKTIAHGAKGSYRPGSTNLRTTDPDDHFQKIEQLKKDKADGRQYLGDHSKDGRFRIFADFTNGKLIRYVIEVNPPFAGGEDDQKCQVCAQEGGQQHCWYVSC